MHITACLDCDRAALICRPEDAVTIGVGCCTGSGVCRCFIVCEPNVLQSNVYFGCRSLSIDFLSSVSTLFVAHECFFSLSPQLTFTQ